MPPDLQWRVLHRISHYLTSGRKDIKMSEVDQTLVAKYLRHKDQAGYTLLNWSGRIIDVLAYLSLIATAFTTMVAGVLSFILMRGLSSTCFLLLDSERTGHNDIMLHGPRLTTFTKMPFPWPVQHDSTYLRDLFGANPSKRRRKTPPIPATAQPVSTRCSGATL